MKKALLIVLALALLCASAVMAQYNRQEGMPGMPNRQSGMGLMACPAMAIAPPVAASINRLSTILALTDDQKAKFTATLTKSDSDLASLRKTASAATKALRDAIYASTYDSAKVAELLTAAEKAESAITSSELATWGEIRTILTADQVSKLSTPMARQGGFRGQNRQQMAPPPTAAPESEPAQETAPPPAPEAPAE